MVIDPFKLLSNSLSFIIRLCDDLSIAANDCIFFVYKWFVYFYVNRVEYEIICVVAFNVLSLDLIEKLCEIEFFLIRYIEILAISIIHCRSSVDGWDTQCWSVDNRLFVIFHNLLRSRLEFEFETNEMAGVSCAADARSEYQQAHKYKHIVFGHFAEISQKHIKFTSKSSSFPSDSKTRRQDVHKNSFAEHIVCHR